MPEATPAPTSSPPPPPAGRGKLIRLVTDPTGWVHLRDADDLYAGDREVVMAKFPADGNMTPVAVIAMQRELAGVVVDAWHLPYLPGAALPCDDPSTLKKLRLRDERQLYKAIQPILDLFNPDGVDPGDVDDPDSPTGP